ncbi:MAG: peptide chain release factor N(5)-glutamine methyltransferase [Mycobacterium sp.]|nr:peptide chain release factor N(5)-glutamine methyltransferase [Mycobacterium sp.]
MTALRAAITAAAATLSEAGIDCARTDAELLAAYAAGTERSRLLMLDSPDADFYNRFGDAVAVRARRVPLQHITGTAAFGPVQVAVGPGVFIPRPETESLLEWVLAQQLPREPVIVDLCTGSGALALALAAALPSARVIAVDDDDTALDYARRNVEGSGIRLVRGDVTDARLLPELAGSVDLVVANPPYIPTGAVLEPEVAQHDPAHALFGGPDGMAVIAPIVRHAAQWLRAGGLLAVEHDDTTSERTVALIRATGAFGEVVARCDLAGRERFVTARAIPGAERGEP